MKHKRAYRALCVSTFFLALVVSSLAQESAQPVRVGIPQDWTQHHLIFSRAGVLRNPSLLSSEPRVMHQALQRWAKPRPQVLSGANVPVSTTAPPQRDWNVSLGLGRVAPNMFPAKYSFDAGAPPDCTNDYVVFGLNHAGTATQANLVAFNNLYSAPVGPSLCNAAAPSFLFAYNITTLTAGRVLTSPALSLDGKKIAFVESGNIAGVNKSVFHVLTWATGAGNGTSATLPAVPGVGNTASMTSLTFATADLDTRSSPWVDYNTDTAYVGADDGKVYAITGVFKGTPALAGGFWPVTISPNVRASAPVLDHTLGLLMVGSQNGTLYSINTTSGQVKSLVVGRSGSANPGILAPPVVDVVNGTTFAVSANDGTSGVFVQVNTATMSQITKARIGLASKSGTAVSLFQPAFSDAYFNNPSTGVARLCGTGAADTTPWQYGFSFTGTTMNATPAFSQQLLTSTTARCTGWSEFFNPNIGPTGTDFFFFGLTADCTGIGTSGCVVSRTNVSLVTADVTGGPSGVVVDNFSTAAQASNIYLTGVQAPNTAYKFTQSGLQ